MSSVRSKGTSIECLARRALHAEYFRFSVDRNDLPGSPDIVLPEYKVIFFVNLFFWHGRECVKASLPSSNIDIWRNNIKSKYYA